MDLTKAESEVEEAISEGSSVAAYGVTSWIGGYDCRWSIALRITYLTTGVWICYTPSVHCEFQVKLGPTENLLKVPSLLPKNPEEPVIPLS